MKKWAVVTGCAKGIGREIALALAREGYNIIGTYLTSKDDIQKLQSRIETIGMKFDFYKLDLENYDEVNLFCVNVINLYKKIDILVNNASLSLDDEFYNKTVEEFERVMKVNVISPFLLIKNLSKIMNDGRIINISSTDGINTYSKYNIDYSASKAALINMTKSLSLELENNKIYSICPNWVNTETIKNMNIDYLNSEMRRIGQYKLIDPKEVANKVIEILECNYKSGSIIVMEG